ITIFRNVFTQILSITKNIISINIYFMISIIIALIIGIIVGIITGLIPGLHVNTVGIIIFSASTTLLEYTDSTTICSFLVSLALTHAMLEFIPSLLLAVPNEDTIVSIQPAHRLLFKGKGRYVIRLVSLGGYGSLILLIILIPVLFIVLPVVYDILKDYIGYLLVIVMALMIYFTNKNTRSRLYSLLIFLVSGILGLVILNGNMGENLGLLVMLSGLFSISSLLYSININSHIPKQEDFNGVIIDNGFKKSVFAGSISGCILGLLPGLGPAQGTVIAQTLTFNKEFKSEEFIVTNSGINVCDTLFSLIAIYLINNPRSAISVYVETLLGDVTLGYIVLFIFISVISVSISCILSIPIGDWLINNIERVDYQKLSGLIIIVLSIFIVCYTFFVGGCIWYVLLCYITSISLGMIVNVVDISKSNLMGVLIVPSIITYLGLL
ncbi:MAG: tripartite tricarboxylate transporter permease, partial [Methanosphaera sp.]|nr:tripartite tricarboxylate transporter permease [Methanosphaera sp.]